MGGRRLARILVRRRSGPQTASRKPYDRAALLTWKAALLRLLDRVSGSGAGDTRPGADSGTSLTGVKSMVILHTPLPATILCCVTCFPCVSYWLFRDSSMSASVVFPRVLRTSSLILAKRLPSGQSSLLQRGLPTMHRSTWSRPSIAS